MAEVLSAGDAAVSYVFSLVVTDDLGAVSPADTVTITVTSGLTVALSGGPNAITDTGSFNVTATFSKNVIGFTDPSNDVQVRNGRVTSISGDGSNYVLAVAASGGGDVSIAIPVGAARDATGNGASSKMSVENNCAEETQQLIRGLDFTTPFVTRSGTLFLNGGVSGSCAATNDGNTSLEGLRGRAELGLGYNFDIGGILSIDTFHDGIGSDF